MSLPAGDGPGAPTVVQVGGCGKWAAMSTLAAVVDWRESPHSGPGTPDATARRMVDCLRDRAPDGIAVAAAPGVGLAIGKLVVAHKQGHAAQPLVDEEAQLYVVADVRIDNRDDLKAELALPPAATDAEIVLAGYRRWGSGLPEHLIGDFAFVVWDARLRRLFAARDPFGVRPLVYRVLPDRLLVASDVEQILEVDPTAWEVDDHTVVDYLLDSWRSLERTFWNGTVSLLAGHRLEASAGRVSTLRWWRPEKADELEDPREGLQQFRQLLARAVIDRLDSDHPALLQLSGGFDSSSIAIVAAQVGARVPLRAISATHAGLDCDERSLVEAVSRRLSFPVEFWDGTDVVLPDLEDPALAGPGQRIAFNNGSRGGLDIAVREGARVILSGFGGDIWQPNLWSLDDYLSAGHWRQAVELGFLRPRRSWRKRFRLLRLSVRHFVPDPLARRIFFWRSESNRHKVDALTARARRALASEAPVPAFDGGVAGAANRVRLQELTMARTHYGLGLQQRCTSRAGAELRFPFLDTRLLALLWRLPLNVWPAPSYGARFHALALRNDLPAELTLPRRKTLFMSAASHRNQTARPVIERLLAPAPGEGNGSSPRVAAYIQSLDNAQADPSLAWTAGTLEAWLKMVYGRRGHCASEGERIHAPQV